MTSRDESLIPVIQFFHDKSDPTDPLTEETIRADEEPPEERARRRSLVRSRTARGARRSIGPEQSRHPEAEESTGTRRDERRSRSPAGRADRGLSSLRAKPSARPGDRSARGGSGPESWPHYDDAEKASRRYCDFKKTRKRLRIPA